MLAFVVVQGLSLPVAADFTTAWDAYVNRLVKYAILGALIPQFVVSPKTLAYYLFSTLLAFMKVGQEAFLGNVTGSMVWENQGIPRLHGTQGSMFGHPNSLSGKFVSTLPFVLHLWPTVKKRWMSMLLVVYVMFAINILIFTGSRTGYLTLVGVAAVTAILSKRPMRSFAVLLVFAITAVLLVPQDYQERFLSAFTGHEKEGRSKDTRLDLLRDSVSVFAQNPLGVGLQCFPVVQMRAERNAQDTHNLYTQVLAEAGIQGAICFAGLLFVVLRKALRLRHRLSNIIAQLAMIESRAPPDLLEDLREELRTHRFLAAVTNSVIVFIICRLMLGVFGHDLMEIYWWIAAGLTMALHSIAAVAESRVLYLKSATLRGELHTGTMLL